MDSDDELSPREIKALMNQRRMVSNRVNARNSRLKKKAQDEELLRAHEELRERVVQLDRENLALRSRLDQDDEFPSFGSFLLTATYK